MRIYVAHTYGRRHGLSESECEANALKSIEYGRALIKKGHNPFIPNLYHWVHKGWDESLEEDNWLNMVSEWVRFCEALFVAEMPHWKGSGVEDEIGKAKRYKLTIYYDIKEIPDVV